MGSAEAQGRLWSVGAEDWASIQEPRTLPLACAVLDAALVREGTRLLDAGCGAGGSTLLAALRGAEVTAVDAAEGLLAVARRRVPQGDIRLADLEELPFADESFDATIAINSVFFAADIGKAMRELARVTRPGGRVVLAAWGPGEKCQYGEVIKAFGSFLGPPPPGGGGPFALAAPGALEGLMEGAGLKPLERGEVSCPFWFPSADISWRGQRTAGVAQMVIEKVGEEPLRAVISEIDRAHTYPDGSVRYENVFVWAVGQKP